MRSCELPYRSAFHAPPPSRRFCAAGRRPGTAADPPRRGRAPTPCRAAERPRPAPDPPCASPTARRTRAVVEVGLALADVRASDAVALVASVAGARERPRRVGTGGGRRAVVRVQAALVDVVTDRAGAGVARGRGAEPCRHVVVDADHERHHGRQGRAALGAALGLRVQVAQAESIENEANGGGRRAGAGTVSVDRLGLFPWARSSLTTL